MACQAQTATQIFDKTVSAFRNAGTVSASYSMRGSHGTIVMQGSKFRILANNVKAWYDGKTEYTYSKATGEVNITTPSARDLVMVSPLSVAGQVRNSYTMKAKKKCKRLHFVSHAQKERTGEVDHFIYQQGLCLDQGRLHHQQGQPVAHDKQLSHPCGGQCIHLPVLQEPGAGGHPSGRLALTTGARRACYLLWSELIYKFQYLYLFQLWNTSSV